MIAVIDETTPEVTGRILYAVVSAVVLSDEDTARAALATVLPASRTRPFHWHDEGPVARQAMIGCIKALDVIGRAYVVVCGRRAQEKARATALRSALMSLRDDGCARIVIESRGAVEDGRDQRIIREVLREASEVSGLSYEWRGKDDRLLWIADSVAGVARSKVLGVQDAWCVQFDEVAALDITYLEGN